MPGDQPRASVGDGRRSVASRASPGACRAAPRRFRRREGGDMVVYVIVVLVVVLVLAALSVRILKQYERGVQFRLGKVKDGARGPGVIFIIPLVDRVNR